MKRMSKFKLYALKLILIVVTNTHAVTRLWLLAQTLCRYGVNTGTYTLVRIAAHIFVA